MTQGRGLSRPRSAGPRPGPRTVRGPDVNLTPLPPARTAGALRDDLVSSARSPALTLGTLRGRPGPGPGPGAGAGVGVRDSGREGAPGASAEAASAVAAIERTAEPAASAWRRQPSLASSEQRLGKFGRESVPHFPSLGLLGLGGGHQGS